MSDSVTFGTLTSNQTVGEDVPKPETPFRIVVLGDFSGRGSRGAVGDADEIGRRRPRKVERATLDDVIAKLNVSLRLPLGKRGKLFDVAFQTLDDFHPDRLCARIEQFEDLDGAEEKSELMNKVLHHPDFQALEAAWRGVDWLLQGVTRCGAVEIRLIDLSAEELVADLTAGEELEPTGLYQVLVDVPAQRADADPWSVFVGNYLFDLSAEHADVLGRIARIARQASAPFLAGVNPTVLDPKFALDEETEEVWNSLRALPEAAVLGLATPRFLLRPPYGANTKTIDSFEFEEYTGEAGWDHYLWCNTAFACAALLAQSFGKEGWAFQPGLMKDLWGIAFHVTRDEDDEPRSTLAEVWLTRPVTERLVKLGLMPLLCVKGRDAVQLLRFQSLAQPAEGQAGGAFLGRWGQTGMVKLPRTGMQMPISVGVGLEVPTDTPAPPASEDDSSSSDEETSSSDDSEMDPELAALMAGDSDDSGSDSSSGDEMDPELAALMAEMEGGDSSSTSDSDSSGEEMDPELAALMAEMEGGASSSEASGDEEMDPELAALMKEMESSGE